MYLEQGSLYQLHKVWRENDGTNDNNNNYKNVSLIQWTGNKLTLSQRVTDRCRTVTPANKWTLQSKHEQAACE